MSTSSAHRAAVDSLAAFAASLRYDQLPPAVLYRLPLMLTDLLGVTAAGARTPEVSQLRRQWQLEPGDAPLIGIGESTNAETAAYLNAVAACCLELDEGNKHAQGHPAVQVAFAAMAAAQLSPQQVSGDSFLTAVVAGYEVASRFGRALRRNRDWHTHGHWGATGAACAVALIRGGTQDQVAAAIDASTGLMHVTPWEMVLDGNFTRNFWVAGANMAGLQAARLAMAGLVGNSGAAISALGGIVGSLDETVLTDKLGDDWLFTQGYSKRHASCSYTHAAVDIIQTLKCKHEVTTANVAAIEVKTCSLVEPLFRRDPSNRLAAMFSLPFVVGAAVVNEHLVPAALETGTASFDAAQQLSERVSVGVEPAFDRMLPSERWTSVTIHLHEGTALALERPNPIGDIDYFPMGPEEIKLKLEALIGVLDTGLIHDVVARLPITSDTAPVLAQLSHLQTPEPNRS